MICWNLGPGKGHTSVAVPGKLPGIFPFPRVPQILTASPAHRDRGPHPGSHASGTGQALCQTHHRIGHSSAGRWPQHEVSPWPIGENVWAVVIHQRAQGLFHKADQMSLSVQFSISKAHLAPEVRCYSLNQRYSTAGRNPFGKPLSPKTLHSL